MSGFSGPVWAVWVVQRGVLFPVLSLPLSIRGPVQVVGLFPEAECFTWLQNSWTLCRPRPVARAQQCSWSLCLTGDPQPNPQPLSSEEKTRPLMESRAQKLQGRHSLGRGGPCSPPEASVSRGLALHPLQAEWRPGLALLGSTMWFWMGGVTLSTR